MCGISGIVERRGAPDLGALRLMHDSLIHRGPDASGTYTEGPVALAHNRLSIIDLAGGDQPLFSDNNELVLIANGEIYNYREIKAGLGSEYQFKTQSDCEVILPLYEKYGRDCVKHLRGMFAFALWDNKRKTLLLARDRMGEKPIYFCASEQRLLFASELRSLLNSGVVERQLDPAQIVRYFRYQYVPEPDTPFAQIKKLPAAFTLELSYADWDLKVERYWSPWTVEPIADSPEVVLREALEDAIKSSMVSDVPIGLSLSGGVDSSLLACVMRKHSNEELHAISVGYPDADFVDERPQARALAQKLEINFHDVELSDSEMIESFPDVCALKDDPIGDISGFNYYAIMRRAQEAGIKVMIQGHGVDELCWGYGWVQKAVSVNEPKGIAKIWAKIRAKSGHRFQMFELQPFTRWVMEHRSNIFNKEFLDRSGWRNDLSESDYGAITMRADLEVTRLIMEYYLLGNGITQGDRLSMANGVESRLPFVDHKFVEHVVGLRKHARDDHLPAKYWLKKSTEDLLGEEILNRPKKGFAPPGVRWQKALRETYGKELQNGILVTHGIIAPEAARKFAMPNIADASEAIVSRLAIVLEYWARGVGLG